jgi:preprotein translocase subunit Sss1
MGSVLKMSRKSDREEFFLYLKLVLLGLVVVGGLMFSQLVTLYLTPVVYTYMAHLQTWLEHRRTSTRGHGEVLVGK